MHCCPLFLVVLRAGSVAAHGLPSRSCPREVAWGQNAYFPEPTEGTMGALEGELEDGLLEYEGDYGGGQRMIFDLTEALELMDESVPHTVPLGRLFPCSQP